MPSRALRSYLARRFGIDGLRRENAELATSATAHQAAIEQLIADDQVLRDQIVAAEQRSALATEEVAEQLQQVRGELAQAVAAQTVSWATLWAASDPTVHPELVSVVLPTRNRAELLRRAVASVLRQSHEHLELIIVDDGSTDHTADVLGAIDDPRLVVLAGGAHGAAAARNLALEHARGSVIAFADDDNVMSPGWLGAVLDHLRHHPEVDGVYGAQLREPEDGGEITLLYRAPFDREAMLLGPYIDLGAVALRAGLKGLDFDTELTALLDWDMLIRVTEHSTLHPIPVIASLYTTSAPDRISARPDKQAALDTVRDRAAEQLRSAR